MTNCLIKICGVKNPLIASHAALAGADFIGIVFETTSIRHATLEEAKAVSLAAKKAGASPVAVFVNQSLEEIVTICEQANIQIVQLHGKKVRAVAHQLPKHYQRIYVQTISEDGKLHLDAGIQALNPERDFILLDSETPGQGRRIQLHTFEYHLPFKWILAGGLTSANVASVIQTFKPHGVDVSSAVESVRGIKDNHLIEQFIASVRGNVHGKE